MKYLLICLPSIFFALPALAANWYVAMNGSDNQSGTLAAPFKTLEHAIELASPGDAIFLRNGTYLSHEIRITKNNLHIRSYPGEWAVITCALDNEEEASCIWYSEPEVTGGLLENLEITGGYYYGIKFETNWDWGLPAAQIRGVRDVTVRGCKIHHTGRDAVKITPACRNLQFIGCEIYNTGVGPSNTPANGGPNAEGIDNVNGDMMLVRNCYIHHTSTTGVYVKGGATDCIIEENLITNTGEAGILLGFYTDAEFFDQNGTNPAFYECQYSLARNNIIYNTGGAGIGFFAARNCSAYHNTVITASSDFHAPLYFSKGEIWIDENTTLTPANFNIEVYNNIFVDQSPAGDEAYTVQIREGALTGTVLMDYNLYNKTGAAAWFDDGVTWPGLTFAQWKSQLGYDTHSLEGVPQLDNNLHLQAGSPAIDAGKSSPAQRDYDGLFRNGPPDIGADEYNNGTALSVPPPNGIVGTGAPGSIFTGTTVPVSFQNIELLPNPCTDRLILKNLPASAQLILRNSLGKILESHVDITELSVQHLPAGVYFLDILTPAFGSCTEVIIKN